jgi:hypothetical protein
VVPPLRRGTGGRWQGTSAVAARCCRGRPDAEEAAAHLRGVPHAAARVGASVAAVACIDAAVLEAHGHREEVPLPSDEAAAADAWVPGIEELRRLWDAGLHPQAVRAIHDELVGVDGPPLPPVVYLGVLAGRPGMDWVADTLLRIASTAGGEVTEADQHLAAWLVWDQSSLDPGQRRACRAWLSRGVPRAWVADLIAAGYRPGDADALAAGTGRGPVGAASMLRAWAAVGCHPTVSDLLDLHASGVPPWFQPSRGSLDRLVRRLGAAVTPGSVTEVGLALAREGTVAAAERVLRARFESVQKEST